MLMDNGICPTDTHELIESADDCEMAATEVLDNDRYFKFKVINNKKNPKGCFNKGNKLYFNQKGKTTSKNTKKKAICCTAPSTTSSTDMPWTDYDYGNDGNNDGNNGNNGCECKSEWQFDGATYEQCSFTPDDLENSWCYTESECDGSSVSESYAGNSWTFCSIKNNKRASFGSAVQHKSAAATGAAGAGGASSSSDGGSAGAGASGVATAAAGIVATLLVVGALVVVVVNKRQTSAPQDPSIRQRASALDVAEGAADHQLEEGGGIAIPEDAAVDGLERADSYHDAQDDAVAYDTANPSDFAAAQFVLDAAAQGSLKIKSVRRPNPAYRCSAFIENSDTDGI